MGLGVMVLEKLAAARKDTRPPHPTGKLLETETANRNGRCATRRALFTALRAGIAYGVAIGALPNGRECSFKAHRTLDLLAHLIVALRLRSPPLTPAYPAHRRRSRGIVACISPAVVTPNSMIHDQRVGRGRLRSTP
eukprot:CAMPEP_0179440748 /NCGR_PEP_ID=MMETSP0799-20121207/24350_1 /TAXON_ID=46947 /ORGANISM="Geminigera cryophila, Strain CCMP2564" /LENGTH=136 /DNA_ID=CAMNT_0021224413 /DNA_START=634 /DNA_END=1044 /DNA_ORIENTATION=+